MSNVTELSLRQPQTLQPRTQKPIAFLLLAVLVVGAVTLSVFGWRQSVLFLIGSLFGISLYHASFGFASSYRRLFIYGETKGVQAQVLMLIIATLLFAPILTREAVFGQSMTGSVAPLAVQGIVGAFIFGVGMQLGSGCACGTLYTIGGGSSMMLLTLITFGIGSFWATLTGNWWSGLPQTEPLSLINMWGWTGIALQLFLLLLIAVALWFWGRKTGDNAPPPPPSVPPVPASLLYGSWSIALGAVALAVLNWLTLLISGRPWGVTWGFTLWTAKIAQALGWNPETSEFWSQGVGARTLNSSVFSDVISVMNFGIVIGAALAAALAGRLLLKKPPSRLGIVAALIGGLLMGYGARIAFGCNVGAYFSGIASTSLHGWLWITFALLGTAIGVRLRPLFRLSN
ncbi:YeeE/YedE family protein [Egbenema bharatensis]|uniref:YeeE/YedE family protein n=1 Tax=Egbenema bharatensis TaxID=3463334 RepID=UPI003A859D77